MIKTIISIFIFILACCAALISQRFDSLNDNYPIARVNCIYQDDFGFIWFGTRDGMVKYDGYSTIHYRKDINDPTSLPGQEILSIVQFSDSIMLVGLAVNGLIQFNRNTGKCSPFPNQNSFQNINVKALLKDKKNSIWIGTNRGVFKYYEGKIDHYQKEKPSLGGLLNNEIQNFFEDTDGNIWIGSIEGIHKYSYKTDKIENPITNTSFPKNSILDINKDNEGNIWISVNNNKFNFFQFYKEIDQFKPVERFQNGGEFRFVFDKDDNLWVSSDRKGVIKYTDDTSIIFSADKYKEHNFRELFTKSIVQDKYQNIWVGASDIYKLSGNKKNFKQLDTDGFQVSGLYADEEYIWYCAKEPMRWSKKTSANTPLFENPNENNYKSNIGNSSPIRMYHFEEIGDSLIFTSIDAIYIWDRNTDKAIKLPTKLEGAFRDFIKDKENKIIIAANLDNVQIYDPKANTIYPADDLKELQTACAVDISKEGLQCWGTHENGLFLFDTNLKKLSHYLPDPAKPESTLSSFNVTDVLCHTDGTIWIGTNVGLDKIDPITKQVSHYPFGTRLNNVFVSSIIEDNSGALWLGTQDGLLFLDPQKDILRRYTKDDGLLNRIYTPRACFKDAEGRLYFGGMQGIDYFHPDEIGENMIPPDLYIKSLKVNGKNYSNVVAGENIKEINLTHTDNYLEIELIGLHMSSANGNVYAYNLEPQINEYVNLGANRFITLGKLTPGKYTLNAKSANPDLKWSSPKDLLTINVKPPFWLTTWFISISILVLIGFTSFLYRSRVKALRKKESIKTEINKQIAEIEMKALRAQMNPHFLFNCLNSIKLLISNNENEKARKYINKFSDLIRQVLENSREKVIRLEEELNSIEIYLQLEQMRFKNFAYKIEIDKEIPLDFIEIPPLLIQPFVENAIWHGLMNKQNGEKVLKIIVSKNDDNIIIVIEDNGIGRKQAQLLKSGKMKKSTSLGTQLSQNRVMLYNEVFEKRISIHIFDLENPTRTRVEINIPEND